MFSGKFLSIILLTCAFAVHISASFAQKTLNIVDFGAEANNLHVNNASAIQKAIDAATKEGGKVIIPTGIYVSGPIFLKSNVELHFSNNAILLGSTRYLDYGSAKSLIISEGQQNVAITGNGIIDAQGQELIIDLLHQLRLGTIKDDQWLVKRPTEQNRPFVLFFLRCNNVKIAGVTIKNAASWVQNFKECKGIVVENIKVKSTTYWNNDGIDIVDCANVRIANSHFDTADDAICLKSESVDGSCENVLIENCLARSSANAFKIGTGSQGRFANIEVRNLTVFDTYRSAVALETVDGASMENVKISGVKAVNTGNALFIRLGHRNKDDRFSTVKDIIIENLTAEIPSGKPDIGYPFEGPWPKSFPVHNLLPASIVGIPGHAIRNVRLRNIDISYGGGASKTQGFISLDSLANVQENIAGYPEFSMFGDLPSWGLYLRHIESIAMENIKLRYIQDDYRPAILADDIKFLDLNNIVIPASVTETPIILNNVIKPQLSSLKLAGMESEGVWRQSK